MKLNGKVKCSKQITRVYAQFDLQSYIFRTMLRKYSINVVKWFIFAKRQNENG